AHGKHHLITKLSQFVPGSAALGKNFHAGNLWQVLLQGRKEGGIDCQFTLARHLLLDPAIELRQARSIIGLKKLHRGMKSLQQWITANVPEEDSTSRSQRFDRALKHFHQVLDVRKVLDHRVEDDRIETTRFDPFKVISLSLNKFDVRESLPFFA